MQRSASGGKPSQHEEDEYIALLPHSGVFLNPSSTHQAWQKRLGAHITGSTAVAPAVSLTVSLRCLPVPARPRANGSAAGHRQQPGRPNPGWRWCWWQGAGHHARPAAWSSSTAWSAHSGDRHPHGPNGPSRCHARDIGFHARFAKCCAGVLSLAPPCVVPPSLPTAPCACLRLLCRCGTTSA